MAREGSPQAPPSRSAVKALRRVVPWVHEEPGIVPGSLSHETSGDHGVQDELSEEASTAAAMSAVAASIAASVAWNRPPLQPRQRPAPDAAAPAPDAPSPALDVAAVRATPWQMIAGFPPDVDGLLELAELQERRATFTGESIVDVVLRFARLGTAEMSRELAERQPEIGSVGERQRLLNTLGRITHQLHGAMASLLDPTLEARLAGLAGDNLLAFVSTFPRSEEAAVSAIESVSIESVVNAIFHDAPGLERLRDRLVATSLGWLTDSQVNELRTLACLTLACVLDSGLSETGALASLQAYRQLCEAALLLPPLPPSRECSAWLKKSKFATEAGTGAAVVIVSQPRFHLWNRMPPALRFLPAIMGAGLPLSVIGECCAAARRTLTRGEIGILHSNHKAWSQALEMGMEWVLIFEDDAVLVPPAGGTTPADNGGSGEVTCQAMRSFLSRLPMLIDAATMHDPEWQLLVLTPVNVPYDFFRETPARCIPLTLSSTQLIRKPVELKPPSPCNGSGGMHGGWQRCPPTYHAFAWVYRRPLMQKLVDAFVARQPCLEPLDIWVWEVMAQEGMLGKALCPRSPIVDKRGLASIKDSQDDPSFLRWVYEQRGYGK